MHDSTIAGGPVGNWLAIIGVISLIYWGWRICVWFMSRRNQMEVAKAPNSAAGTVGGLAASVAPAPSQAASDHDIAAIAAAVYATVGAHRIVHLQAEEQGRIWAAEGRWRQQTSHDVHPRPPEVRSKTETAG